jgi:hypothetical protein
MKLRSVADSLFTYLLQLKHDDRNCSFFHSMRIRTDFSVDEIVLAVIEHDDKAICSRPKAVLPLIGCSLQLIPAGCVSLLGVERRVDVGCGNR